MITSIKRCNWPVLTSIILTIAVDAAIVLLVMAFIDTNS